MDLSDIYIPPTPEEERDILRNEVKMLRAEVERLRAKCDELTIDGFSAQLKQLDSLRTENARLKDVVAGYAGSGQRMQDLSDDVGLLEASNKNLAAEVERLRSLTQWQPMETAKRTYTSVLLLLDNLPNTGVGVGWWNGHGWVCIACSGVHVEPVDDKVRGWMPLPKPPQGDIPIS